MCLGLLKKIQKVRPDLRIIVASATLDAEFFKDFFNHNLTDNSEADTATIIHLEGRTYPVDIFYLEKACPDYMKESMETVLKIHRENKLGDILVFVTSAEDCDSLCDNLRDEVGKVISKAQGIGVPLMKMKALPLYGSLPVIDQMRVFETLPRNTRKVIVSTNIAETSLTLPGIVHVIDAGFVKISAYNPKNGLDSTTTVPVSQAAANQRAGRAGRVRSGCCYRLYTQDDFEKLMPATVPEMRRSELTSTILRLKQLGISNVVRFDFPSPPPAQALSRSLELLFALGKVKNTHSNFITGLFRSRRWRLRTNRKNWRTYRGTSSSSLFRQNASSIDRLRMRERDSDDGRASERQDNLSNTSRKKTRSLAGAQKVSGWRRRPHFHAQCFWNFWRVWERPKIYE